MPKIQDNQDLLEYVTSGDIMALFIGMNSSSIQNSVSTENICVRCVRNKKGKTQETLTSE
jgi:hypothetical protein